MSEVLTVSVCVVTYNHAAYIEQCLVSILDQEGDFSLEVLVGEDCSTDSTRDIILGVKARYPQQLKVNFNENNLGAQKNTVVLLSAVQGELVAMVDGDDFWLPGKLQKQIDYLKNNPECVAAYTGARHVDQSGRDIKEFSLWVPALFSGRYLLARGNFLHYSSLIFYRQFQDVILNPPEYGALDYNIHLRLGVRGMLGCVNEALTGYRVGLDSSMMNVQSDTVRERIWCTISDPVFRPLGNLPRVFGGAVFVADLLSVSYRSQRWALLSTYIPRIPREQGLYGCCMLLIGVVYFCLRGLLRTVSTLVSSPS